MMSKKSNKWLVSSMAALMARDAGRARECMQRHFLNGLEAAA